MTFKYVEAEMIHFLKGSGHFLLMEVVIQMNNSKKFVTFKDKDTNFKQIIKVIQLLGEKGKFHIKRDL